MKHLLIQETLDKSAATEPWVILADKVYYSTDKTVPNVRVVSLNHDMVIPIADTIIQEADDYGIYLGFDKSDFTPILSYFNAPEGVILNLDFDRIANEWVLGVTPNSVVTPFTVSFLGQPILNATVYPRVDISVSQLTLPAYDGYAETNLPKDKQYLIDNFVDHYIYPAYPADFNEGVMSSVDVPYIKFPRFGHTNEFIALYIENDDESGHEIGDIVNFSDIPVTLESYDSKTSYGDFVLQS